MRLVSRLLFVSVLWVSFLAGCGGGSPTSPAVSPDTNLTVTDVGKLKGPPPLPLPNKQK